MIIDLTNAHPCPDCRRCLTNAAKCQYCSERDQLRAEVERLRADYEQLTQLCRATEERERSALTTVAGLRRALEEMRPAVVENDHRAKYCGCDECEGNRLAAEIDTPLAAVLDAMRKENGNGPE